MEMICANGSWARPRRRRHVEHFGGIAYACALAHYRDIGKHFGISRATIARRLKHGLVPGVRFQHQRMLDDGPVRRFDRLQLRWLLLAIRARGAR
jgi:hypothetical protein